jgi:hypothetical protein
VNINLNFCPNYRAAIFKLIVIESIIRIGKYKRIKMHPKAYLHSFYGQSHKKDCFAKNEYQIHAIFIKTESTSQYNDVIINGKCAPFADEVNFEQKIKNSKLVLFY